MRNVREQGLLAKFTIRDGMPNIPNAHYYEYREILYPYETVGMFPLPEKRGLERFLPLLPIEQLRVVLVGQVEQTPINRVPRLGESIGLHNLWVKHEEVNPTGSFKDRESSVVISVAVEQGIKRVNILSSGNAALSTAAYAQQAGIECVCYVPAGNSQEKQELILLFGARLITFPTIYEDMYKQVVDENPQGWNVTTGQNEYRIEGAKTMSFEIVEQLGRVPDVIVVPTGAGSCLAAIWKGFVELHKIGKIDDLPQMVAVQTQGGAPIAKAFETGQDFAVLGTFEDSIAEGVAAEESFCSPKAVRALRESGGYVIKVNEKESVEALRQVVRLESFVPEPTTAAAYAGLVKIRAHPDDLILIINTGSGMKMLNGIIDLLK